MVFVKNAVVFIIICLFFSSCSDTSTNPDPGNQDVQIFFKYNYQNVLNTFDNTFQKDLIHDGVIKVKFSLTKEEHERILQKALELGFFSLPDTLKTNPNQEISYLEVEPLEQLRIKTSSFDHMVVWHNYVLLIEQQYTSIEELRKLIISVIQSKSQYFWLPEPAGGYL